MRVDQFAEQLKMVSLVGGEGRFREVNGIYICDLLSWVMSHAKSGEAWITIHTHINIIAVAVMADISCIIIPEGIEVEEPTLKKAAQEVLRFYLPIKLPTRLPAKPKRYYESIYRPAHPFCPIPLFQR